MRRLKLLLTGLPGTGKTTLVRQLVHDLQAAGFGVGGFVTGEVREDGRRVGFVVETIGGGPTAVLAHVDLVEGPQVGRYRVDVPAFERVAIPALEGAVVQAGIIVIDELGLMELLSDDFVGTVRRVFDRKVMLVATVHARSHKVTDELKSRDDVELFEVTPNNRDQIRQELRGRLLGEAGSRDFNDQT